MNPISNGQAAEVLKRLHQEAEAADAPLAADAASEAAAREEMITQLLEDEANDLKGTYRGFAENFLDVSPARGTLTPAGRPHTRRKRAAGVRRYLVLGRRSPRTPITLIEREIKRQGRQGAKAPRTPRYYLLLGALGALAFRTSARFRLVQPVRRSRAAAPPPPPPRPPAPRPRPVLRPSPPPAARPPPAPRPGPPASPPSTA
ncbi:uncharacterized protein SOCE26_069300 [Sorangium cellulosum]|uniref:Uncharacterized protein n=1 Tax=Sorangium cellulosum TaxID=56 RepID=A0A2L0F1U8_SORCE|nr:uncharacterized protein SOCE26_069300 [Sorangium cellulosum]